MSQSKTTSKPTTAKKTTDVSPAAKSEASPAPAAADDKAHVFQQGRTAALGSISADDAPYDKSDANHAAWLAGHKSVTG